MKKIFLPILALACASLVGCSNFLDVKPENSYTVDTYFSSDQQAIDAVDWLDMCLEQEAMYSCDIHADVCCTNMLVPVRSGMGAYVNNYKLQPTGDDGGMPSIYNSIYGGMAASNWVIERLLKKEKSTPLTYVENRSLGEAYFHRAFYQYLAASRYGSKEQGVPFVAYETFEGGYDYSIPPQLPSVIDNFELTIKDFEAAYERLPKISEYTQQELGRPQKEACLAMEARIYSYWATWDKSKWDNVISTVDKLESMGRKLTDSYALNFSGEPTEFFTSEYCWGLPVVAGGKDGGGVWFNEVLMPVPLAPQLDGWGEYTTSKDMYKDMLADGENNDRLARNIYKAGDNIVLFGNNVTIQPQYGDAYTTGYFVYKWCDALTHPDGAHVYYNTSGRQNMMFHICRFADCLLLRAEANLAKGNAAQATIDINKVRTRSHCPAIATATWADIYHERRCELCFEGMDYFYECKRWAVGGAAEIKALAIKELEGHALVGDWQKDESGNWVDMGDVEYQVWNFEKHWEDYKIALPYPSTVVVNSAGALKQNPGY